MNDVSTHIAFVALFVPDLQAAERYYQTLFDMELIGREAEGKDGLWYTLPRDKDWDDARAAGIELDMLSLRKGDTVLALFSGGASVGQVYKIGITMPPAEIAKVRGRLPNGTELIEDEPEHLEFRDPYQISWEVSAPGTKFRTHGDFANRWLKV